MSQEETFNNGKEEKLAKGEVNEEHLNWLKRSLVCVFDEPRELDVLETALNTCQLSEVHQNICPRQV